MLWPAADHEQGFGYNQLWTWHGKLLQQILPSEDALLSWPGKSEFIIDWLISWSMLEGRSPWTLAYFSITAFSVILALVFSSLLVFSWIGTAPILTRCPFPIENIGEVILIPVVGLTLHGNWMIFQNLRSFWQKICGLKKKFSDTKIID